MDDYIERCAWYTTLAGANPQNGEPLTDTSRCAIAWMPLLQVEVAGTNRGQTAALESFRNEMVKGQGKLNNILDATPAGHKRIT